VTEWIDISHPLDKGGHDRMEVGLTTTYTISAYHHLRCGRDRKEVDLHLPVLSVPITTITSWRASLRSRPRRYGGDRH
jgi:hypothetical protein